MSNADRTNLQIKKETSFGVAATSAFELMRFTSETLTRETSTTNSATIRPDRNIEDVVRTSVNATLALSQEMDIQSVTSKNGQLLQIAAVGAAAATPVSTTVFDQSGSNEFSLEAYNAAQTPKHGVDRDAGSDALTGYSVGDWIRLEVPNNLQATVGSAANKGISGGGYFRVVGAAAASLELEGSEILVDQVLTSDTKIRDADLVFENGVADTSFTVQKSFSDVDSGEGMQGVGMTVDSYSISVSPENIITTNVTFQGQNASHLAALTTGSQVAASTAEILNAVDNVAGIYVKRGTSGQDTLLRPLSGVTSFELNISNNLRMRNEVGTLGPASFGQGAIDVNGTIQVYYDAATSDIIEKLYEGFEDSSLAIALESGKVNEGFGAETGATATNNTTAICIHLPRVKFIGATRTATGTGTDIIAELSFQAFYDPTATATNTINFAYFV